MPCVSFSFVLHHTMPIIEISSLTDPGIDVYSSLTERQLQKRLDPENSIFIAESPKVINVALDAGYHPLSLLCERRHIEGDAVGIIIIGKTKSAILKNEKYIFWCFPAISGASV